MPKGIPKSGVNKGRFQKGQEPWNKGAVGVMPEGWLKGTKGVAKANSGSFEKGNTPWNADAKPKFTCEVCGNEFKASPSHKRKYCSSDCYRTVQGEKISKALTGRKQTKEHIRNSLRRREMSSLEEKMLGIIKDNDLPYKFVGNGDFFIERKNPDFINTNGSKIAIEVFWRGFKTKKCFHGKDLDEWKADRLGIFKKYGWDIVFFDETQVNEKDVLNALGG